MHFGGMPGGMPFGGMPGGMGGMGGRRKDVDTTETQMSKPPEATRHPNLEKNIGPSISQSHLVSTISL